MDHFSMLKCGQKWRKAEKEIELKKVATKPSLQLMFYQSDWEVEREREKDETQLWFDYWVSAEFEDESEETLCFCFVRSEVSERRCVFIGRKGASTLTV